jgi:EmrB/QacA subfamily drug resistance transporter
MWAVAEPCDENIIRSGKADAPCSRSRGNWVLAATILASGMAFIDGTVVNIALPFLQSNFNATALDVQWVIEAYSLLLSALLLTGGSLGDHYGRRRVFVIGIVVFAAASFACGLAMDVRQLIAARALQGFGAALLVPGSLALISSSFSEQDRGRAIGTWSAFGAITTAIGPVTGGWLIEHISWRAVFFINLPIALVVIVISLRYIGESSDTDRSRIDWWGSTLATSGLGTLVYGLIESSRLGFRDREILIALGGGGVLLSLFLIVEFQRSHPMLPLALFSSRVFTGTNLLTFFLYAALGGMLFFLPLNLIQVQHYSATQAGAAMLPFILVISLLSRWSGNFVVKHGARLPLIAGPLIAALGYLLLGLAGNGGTYWTTFFAPILIIGLGMAVSVAPLTTTVMSSVPANRAGVASGINNAVARTAGLIAIAVLGIVMLHLFDRELGRRVSELHLTQTLSQSLHTQHTKLAAISLPEGKDWQTQQLVRNAIQQSFIFGFRLVTMICASLAMMGAVSAGVFLRVTRRSVHSTTMEQSQNKQR